MAFNLKKHAQIKNYDKMLVDQTKDMGLEAEENPTNYNGLLESDRVGDAVDKTSTYENHLDDAREGNDDQVIAEKAMDKASGLTSRHEDGEHPMDYHKQGESDQRKAFNMSEYNKGKGQRVVDKDAGEQLMGEGNKKMVGNVQPSQLLSNHETREDFEKKNKMASVKEKLVTADSMLYAIYRKAADEDRELTDIEKNNIEKISEEKASVLAQSKKKLSRKTAQLSPPIYDEDRGKELIAIDIRDYADDLGMDTKTKEYYVQEGFEDYRNAIIANNGPENVSIDAVVHYVKGLMDEEVEDTNRMEQAYAPVDRRNDPQI
jgi:hypothetical protein